MSIESILDTLRSETMAEIGKAGHEGKAALQAVRDKIDAALADLDAVADTMEARAKSILDDLEGKSAVVEEASEPVEVPPVLTEAPAEAPAEPEAPETPATPEPTTDAPTA